MAMAEIYHLDNYRRSEITPKQSKAGKGLVNFGTVNLIQEHREDIGLDHELEQRIDITFAPEDIHKGIIFSAIAELQHQYPSKIENSINISVGTLEVLFDAGIKVSPLDDEGKAKVIFLSQFESTDTTPEPA